MDARTRFRRAARSAGLLTLLWGTSGSATAQVAMPPSSPPDYLSTPAERVEVYHGVHRVGPVARPPVVLVEYPRPTPIGDDAAHNQALAETLREVRESNRQLTTAVAKLAEAAERPPAPQAEPRPIIFASYPPVPNANAPWLNPAPGLVPVAPPPAPAPVQPTFVVVREPAPPAAPAVPQPVPATTGLNMPSEAALGIGAAIGIFGLLAWARGRRIEPAPITVSVGQPVAAAPAALIETPGVRLMGEYNAGPLPESAEAFDVGPSYQEELAEQKRIEKANEAAATELLLSTNLALLSALNPEPGEGSPEVDEEGFAIDLPVPAPAAA